MKMSTADLLIVGILCVFVFLNGAYAQDRSRSRYIPSGDEESFVEEVPKVTRTSRRIQSPTRSRTTLSPTDVDDTRLPKETSRSSNRRQTSLDDHLGNARSESQSNPGDSYSRNSQIQSLSELVREDTPEATTSPPVKDQQERRTRPKKRRRPKQPQYKLDEETDLPAPNHENIDKPPELDSERRYSGFRNSKQTESIETIPSRGSSLSRSSPSLNTRTRGQSLPDTRNRNQAAPDTRSRHQPSEDTKSHAQSRESTASNSNSRTSRRHSYLQQPNHNRLPIPDEEIPRNLEPQSNKNKESQNIEQPLYSPEYHNSNSPSNLYSPEYRPLNSDAGPHLPYQPPTEDRLPSSEKLSEPVESEIHLPPAGQPYDVSEFAQPGVDYSDLPRESELKLPLNSANLDNVDNREEQENTKFPIPTNRLPNPAEVIYKPHGESTDHSRYLHSSNDEASDLKNHQTSHETDRRIPTDRYQSQPQHHSGSIQREPQSGSTQLRRGQIEANSRRSPQSRVGSRYEPENTDDENLSLQRDVNSNRSGPAPDPRLQNVANRYLQSHRGGSDRTLEEQPPSPRTRTEIPLQRAGSRYQADSLDVDDYESSRNPSPAPERTAPAAIEPTRQRTVPRSQRARPRVNRYQPDSDIAATDPVPEDTIRRVPERPQRTRSRYQSENAVLPNPPLQEEPIRAPVEPSTRSRSVPRRDRTSHRYQGPNQNVPNPAPVDPPQDFHRSRPQFEDDSRRTPYQEEPEYVPEYQNTPRTTQRRPSPQPAAPQPQAVPRQRSVPRQSHQAAPPRRQAYEQPASRGSKSPFHCPDDYGFFPDENQCDKYYECRNGTAEEGLCSDGLVFNLISAPTYLRCDSLRDVDCSARPNLQEPQSTKNCPRGFGLFPHKTDCTKFWQCVDGAATEVKCPPGLVYDDSKGTCNWADLVEDTCTTEDLLGFTCPEATKAELLDGVYTRYPHPNNCQLHFTCIKGIGGLRRPRMLSCNEGLVFDPESRQCTRPEYVPGCEEFYGKPVRQPARQQARDPAPEEEQPPPSPRNNSRRRRPNQQRNRS